MNYTWRDTMHKQEGDTLFFIKFKSKLKLDKHIIKHVYIEGTRKTIVITKVCTKGYYAKDRDNHIMFIRTDLENPYYGNNILYVKDRPNCYVFDSEKVYREYLENSKGLERLRQIVDNLNCFEKYNNILIKQLNATYDNFVRNFLKPKHSN